MVISYVTTPKKQEDIYLLYEFLGWNSFLQLNEKQLYSAMDRSFLVIYAYNGEELIGTGRVVSDGIINAYICGLGVKPQYRNRGIGGEISKRLVENCEVRGLHIQLFCEEKLVPYYERKGFEIFALGMKKK
jgi:ribosomal protein S18 acetylase RimI-like enzyme